MLRVRVPANEAGMVTTFIIQPGKSHCVTATDLSGLSSHKLIQIQGQVGGLRPTPQWEEDKVMCGSVLKLPQAPTFPVTAKICEGKGTGRYGLRR